jgi:hypothetical protein
MKSRFIVIAMALSLGISAARGTPTLNITEFPAKPSFTFDHFVATFNGAPASFVTITLTSAHNGEELWTITFSDGWRLDLPNDVTFFTDEIGEPEGRIGPNGRFENFLIFFDSGHIEWSSEHQNTVGPQPFFSVERGFLLSPKGQRVDIRVADVPEPSSTITLFGIGLAGVASIVRFGRRAV